MRLWLTGGVLLLMLAASSVEAFEPLHRPDAVLAAAPALPAGGDEAPPATWLPDERLACAGVCRATVPAIIVPGTVELWVTWDGTRDPGFVAALDGVAGLPAFDAVRLGPVRGGETLTLWGTGEASLVFVEVPDGVPELAALVPANLGAPLGGGRGHGWPSRAAPDCLEEEVELLRVQDCFRFTTGVANRGDAPLALSSDVRDGEARMTQHLPAADREVGLATYHDVHGHFHYARFVAFDLHARDVGTGLRGALVASSEKTGFCMVDFGRVRDAPLAGHKTYWRDGCAPGRQELAMGMNPGWYDIYRWFLPEQLLDPTALPDGTYELVVTVDPDGTLVEGNPLDNRASAVFSWHAGRVTVLSTHGLYHLVPEPS